MRIAIVLGAFLPVPTLLGGAVEKMWFSLGKEFARQGHEVVQVSRQLRVLPQTEVIEGVQHIRVAGSDMPQSSLLLKMYDFLYTLRVRKALTGDFDIIITNTFWAPILLPRPARQVCIVDVARMPKGQMKFYGDVARLRANSSAVVAAIKAELPAREHPRIVMIPNPLPFVPTVDIDPAHKKPVILYVGRVHPEKGLDLLINAYRQTDRHYRLKIVGPSEVTTGGGGRAYLNKLKALVADAPVEFVGPVYDIEALNKLYAEAAIFVYPSIAEMGETFGLAPLEAMAWGGVPIVSDLACFRDFISDGENGLVFDHRAPDAASQLAKHITDLQQNPDYRMQLAQWALAVRQTHSSAQIARAFAAEFNLINQESHAAGPTLHA